MKYEDQRKETPFAARDHMLDIREHITELAFRGFGKRPRKLPKEPGNFELWSEESRSKWRMTQEEKLRLAEAFDQRFIEDEFTWFNSTLRHMVDLIDQANTLSPQTEHECDIQRDMQNEVIGLCSNLIRELNHIAATIPCNKNFLVLVVNEIDNEIAILRGWRKSCFPLREQCIKKDTARRLKAERAILSKIEQKESSGSF